MMVLSVINLGLLALLWHTEASAVDGNRYAMFVTYIPQQVFGIPLACLLIRAMKHRDRWLLAVNLLVACFFAFTYLGINIPSGRAIPSGGLRVRVMTYNIHHAAGGVKNVANVILSSHADIVSIQEAQEEGGSGGPMPDLMKLLPGWNLAWRAETAVVSRYPVVSEYIHNPPSGSAVPVLEADLMIDGQAVTVLAFHFAKADPRDLIGPYAQPDSNLRRSAEVRESQCSTLIDAADAQRVPVIIAGDLGGTPPRGLLYEQLASRYGDAFRTAGWGAGNTFLAGIPLTRIDYIFTGPGVRTVHCGNCWSTVSNHRPVVADLVLPCLPGMDPRMITHPKNATWKWTPVVKNANCASHEM
jgi:endonuclease/exonuclease/phosphatase (EEP) superfamily protein YafD